MLVETVKKNWLIIVIAIVVIIFLFIMSQDDQGINESAMTPISVDDTEEKEENQSIETKVVVDVKGEVNKPGVYEIAHGVRINDVIDLAGGLTKHADEIQVNLARKVQDEMTIVVPKMGEDSVAVDGGSVGGNKVKINNATQEEIETLSGIGPSKAQAIIQHRDEHGFFQAVEDLLEISGIGEKTLANIQDDIQIP